MANKSVEHQSIPLRFIQICDQWIHTVPMSYRTLNSDDFHCFALQGWNFKKSKFKIKLSKKFDNLISFVFSKTRLFLAIFAKLSPTYQFSKKKRKSNLPYGGYCVVSLRVWILKYIWGWQDKAIMYCCVFSGNSENFSPSFWENMGGGGSI